MGEPTPKVQPDKVKLLPPLAQPSLESLSFHSKNLRKHPLLPIIIGLLCTGLGKDMLGPPLWAIGICALWLWIDLFPLARRTGVWAANRFASEYHTHLAGFGRKEAQSKRALLNNRITYLAFSLIFLVLLAGYLKFAKWEINRYQKNEQEEVANRIEAVATMDSSGEPRFSFTNNSTHDLTLWGISCHPRYARTTQGLRLIDTPIVAFNGKVLVHRNGDGQSTNCNVAPILGDHGPFVCADMTWEVTYTLFDQPNTAAMTNRYRFFLNPQTNEWVRVGLETPPQHCPGE